MLHPSVEDQGTMLVRLQNVEKGVKELDAKVSLIDDKVSHSINIQGENGNKYRRTIYYIKTSDE